MIKQKTKGFENDEALASYFNQRIDEFGPGTDALQWISKETQHIRYNIIANNIHPDCETILDVGCGCGDFYDYLKQSGFNLSYKGIDISAKMICATQHAYPNANVSCLALDDLGETHKADVVIASGLMNLRMINHDDYIIKTIRQLIQLSRKQVIFNILSDKVAKLSKNQQFVYLNAQSIADELSKDDIKVRIIDNYLRNDTTFVLEKL